MPEEDIHHPHDKLVKAHRCTSSNGARAVVHSSIVVLVANYVITSFLV